MARKEFTAVHLCTLLGVSTEAELKAIVRRYFPGGRFSAQELFFERIIDALWLGPAVATPQLAAGPPEMSEVWCSLASTTTERRALCAGDAITPGPPPRNI